MCATWQRCRVHFMLNALARAGKSGRRVASAFRGVLGGADADDCAESEFDAGKDGGIGVVGCLATCLGP